MNEQEMQFADPEWKPVTQSPVQNKNEAGGVSSPRSSVNYSNDNSQSSHTLPAYEQGYQGGQRRLPPVPYIAPVSQQRQTGPALAPRRRSRLWIWIIIAIVAIYLFSNMSSFQSNRFSFPTSPNMPPAYSHTAQHDLTDVSSIYINNQSGDIHVRIEATSSNEISVRSDDGADITDIKGLLSVSINGDATITLPADAAASLNLAASEGSIEIDGYNGQLSAQTASDGSITLNNSQLTGQSTLTSNSGNINLTQSNASGTTTLISESGTISLDQANLSGEVTISTGEDGDVSFNGQLDQQGKYSFTTSSGSLDLNLPADDSLQVNVNKGADGSYQSDFDANPIGGKAPSISINVKTNDGAIGIHKQ